MARDEFFRDIRRAVSFMAPRVEADSPFTDAKYIERMLRESDLWLSRKVVEAFHPDDYSDLDDGTRKVLVRAAKEFLAVAITVPLDAPATREQRDAAPGTVQTHRSNRANACPRQLAAGLYHLAGQRRTVGE